MNNARTHSEEQVTQIASSIKEFGFNNPILIDGDKGVIAGHGRLMAAKKLGLEEVPTIELTGLTETQKKAYILADNKIALNSGWDEELLRIETEELAMAGVDMEMIGFNPEELRQIVDGTESASSTDEPKQVGILAEKFLAPPFSILDTRKGAWKERVNFWKSLGIKSEVGRDDSLLGYTLGKDIVGVSIFDPVLCELMYSWFSCKGAKILDPFAGGSVRGIVASMLDRQYVGNDLRAEQVAANREQADRICESQEFPPVWSIGDSQNIRKLAEGYEADFVFSCPPYADLEVYSDDPHDISNMKYGDFLVAYRKIIAEACAMLKNDRFACFVVTEVRDGKGIYHSFVQDTINAFRDAGLNYYNEIILVNSARVVARTAGRQFGASRKVGRCHQNVLVFVKGDPKKATEFCGDVEILEVTEEDEAEE